MNLRLLVKHVKGPHNVLCDMLSRWACPENKEREAAVEVNEKVGCDGEDAEKCDDDAVADSDDSEGCEFHVDSEDGLDDVNENIYNPVSDEVTTKTVKRVKCIDELLNTLDPEMVQEMKFESMVQRLA